MESNDATTDLTLSLVLVSILKEYPELITKSQLPGVRTKKATALKKAKEIIMTKMGLTMDEKKISKQISNMKAQLKKKTDAKETGNRKIIPCPWEQEFFSLIQGDGNPTVTKMYCAVSAGLLHQSPSSNENNKVSFLLTLL